MRKLLGLALLTAMSACAPKAVPVPVVTTPKFPDFITPAVPPALASTPAAAGEERGWRFLQVGDLRNAEREFSAALEASPAFYPAETSLGYVELARKDANAALPHFERVLAEHADDVSSLVGRGTALLALEREPEAIAVFEAAVAADPSLTNLERRVAVLRFEGSERDVERARQAARSGKLDDAVAAYRRALGDSPDSAFLYRELAGVERQKGDADAALEHFRKTAALDPSDARSLIQIGEILESRGDFEGAERSYVAASEIEPGEAVTAKVDAVRSRIELAHLPEEYRAIEQAPEIMRADLAALIGVRLAPLLQAPEGGDVVLLTDVRSNWASAWIVAVARAGVMEPLANHAFQPRAVVRRIDLAQAVSRLLALIAVRDPSLARSWDPTRVRFSDLSPGHLAYPAAAAAVAARVMTVGPDGSFQPSRPVSGAEATAAMSRVEALARPLGTAKGKSVR